MQEVHFNTIVRLVAEDAGLQVRPEDREKLSTVIEQRMESQRLASIEAYIQTLLADDNEAHRERESLAANLTVGESYFFRDQGQFTLLQEQILPELIARNRDSTSLRIWSAGCSSGEEPYSLAILLDRLLPDRAQWEVTILGTDIHQVPMDRARKGVYSSWSLRGIDPDIREAYFEKVGNRWELVPAIRRAVRFKRLNLHGDPFPILTLCDMDLILCRNVFIYLARSSVAGILEKFTKTLKEGGYLLTGHAELYDQDLSPLVVRVFPNSVIYQRKRKSVCPEASPVAEAAHTSLLKTKEKTPPNSGLLKASLVDAFSDVDLQSTPESDLNQAEACFRNRDYLRAIHLVEAVLFHEPRNIQALCLVARVHADTGAYGTAADYSQRALAADPFCEQAYYLLAHLSEAWGKRDEARMYFKRCLYLAPSFIPPYLHLGAIYERERNIERAIKMFQNALILLRELPEDASVEPYEDDSAAAWVSEIEGKLKMFQRKDL